MKLSFLTRIPWRALILAWLAFMTGSLALDGLKGDALFVMWWRPLGQYQGLITALVCLVFIITSIGLYHNRQAFSRARSLSRHLCEPHAVVILLVSPARPALAQTSPLFPLHITDDRGNSVKLTGASLADDIQALDAIMWNWQQLLRAIVPHVSNATLQRLHLIGSPGARGSFEQLPLCQQLLAHYLPQVPIVPERTPVDFEDFNALVRCMRCIVEDEKRQGMSERDIIIDVTGGSRQRALPERASRLTVR